MLPISDTVRAVAASVCAAITIRVTIAFTVTFGAFGAAATTTLVPLALDGGFDVVYGTDWCAVGADGIDW
jgi:hypothetical protein